MAEAAPILVHIVSSRLWGGMERYALDISRAFTDKGWTVEVFTRDSRAIDTMFARAGIKVHHAPLSGYFDVTTAYALMRFLRRSNRKVVIHTHFYRDAFAALLARKLARKSREQVRVVCTHHSCRPAREGKMMRRIYRNLDAFIFVSDLARTHFLSRWKEDAIPFSQASIHTLHPTITTTSFPEYTPPPEKGPFTLLYLGRLSPEKGLEKLIATMALLKGKRIRLTIKGTGLADYVDSLQRLAVRSGVSNLIDWMGWDEKPIDAILNSHAAICVSPTEEPFSMAALEIMACGRTQIVPPNGAFSEILHPVNYSALSNGEVTDEKNVDSIRLDSLSEQEIADACLWLADHRDICKEMGKNALANFQSRPGEKETMQRLSTLYFPE